MRLHHIGVVTSNLEEQLIHAKEYFASTMVRKPVVDHKQKVRLALVEMNADVLVEYIEPLDDQSPVASAADKGGGLNHLCYAVDDLQAAIRDHRRKGSLLVSEPTPAILFNDRPVAFLYSEETSLYEFIERRRR